MPGVSVYFGHGNTPQGMFFCGRTATDAQGRFGLRGLDGTLSVTIRHQDERFARQELEIVFETLFRRIPYLRLAIDFADVSYKDDRSFFFGLNSLPVTW